MWNRRFWADACERAVKTAAQAAAGVYGADAVVNVTLVDVGIGQAAAVGGTAALVSVLTSVASTARGDHASASALKPPQ